MIYVVIDEAVGPVNICETGDAGQEDCCWRVDLSLPCTFRALQVKKRTMRRLVPSSSLKQGGAEEDCGRNALLAVKNLELRQQLRELEEVRYILNSSVQLQTVSL